MDDREIATKIEETYLQLKQDAGYGRFGGSGLTQQVGWVTEGVADYIENQAEEIVEMILFGFLLTAGHDAWDTNEAARQLAEELVEQDEEA